MAESGVHAEIEVTDSVCRIVDASEHANIDSVNRTAGGPDGSKTVEFTADDSVNADQVSEVFQYGDRTVYRFEREGSKTGWCACEWVESHDTPARHIHADDGTVVLSFVARDLDTLREIVTDLREAFGGVSLRRLTRSADGDGDADLVFVDRAALTARQREVLETAHRMGYFEHPRKSNATDVSAALGINRSTFTEHLTAAQSKLLDTILDD